MRTICKCGNEIELKEEQYLDLDVVKYESAVCEGCGLFYQFIVADLDDEELENIIQNKYKKLKAKKLIKKFCE